MKLTKNQLRKIIKEEVAGVFTEEKASRTIKEAWTSADDGAQAAGDERRAGLKPQVMDMLKTILIPDYVSDNHSGTSIATAESPWATPDKPTLFDVLEDIKEGEANRVADVIVDKMAGQ